MIIDKEPKIIINAEEYIELLHRSNFLEALEIAGVDNWEGFGEAAKLFKETYAEAEKEVEGKS